MAPRKLAATPDFGFGKNPIDAAVTVRVEAPYAPPGVTTAGSTVTLVEDDGTGALVSTRECTTVADAAPSVGSSCDGTFTVAGGDTLTLTQTSAGADFVSGDAQTIGPYQCTYFPVPPVNEDTCSGGPLPVTAVINDTNLPPVVTEATTTVTVPADTATDVNVDEQQIDTHGAPPTSVDVTTEPEHGTVAVVSDTPATVPAAAVAAPVTTPVTGAFHFVYTPTNGYIGPDSFGYSVTTVNGSSGVASVLLKVVGHAPTLRDDSTATKHGAAVTEDVLANDEANGGGTLALNAVTSPKHGTAKIVGDKVRYTPAPDFSGTDTFTYAASTYSGAGSAMVTITVAAAPPTTTAATPTTTAAHRPSTSRTGAASVASTADTGTPSAALIELGGVLLITGAGATVIGRRRRPKGGHA